MSYEDVFPAVYSMCICVLIGQRKDAKPLLSLFKCFSKPLFPPINYCEIYHHLPK